MNWIQSALALLRHDSNRDVRSLYSERLSAYSLYDAYYHNLVYFPTLLGGQREYLNNMLGSSAAADLAGIYNPISRVCDMYQHVFGGTFGTDIRIQSDNEALVPAIEQVWKWSNIDLAKQLLCRFAPLHGNVGIRIVADDAKDKRVFLKVEHPSVIEDVEYDNRGNLIAIQMQYDVLEGLGTNATLTRYKEEQNKEFFRLTNLTKGNIVEEYDNALGVVPYVLLAHTPTGDRWGYNAFYRALPIIDRINALLTHINVQIHRHVKAKWVIAASGSPPSEMDLGDMTVAYINTLGSSSQPTMQPIVAPLSLADAITEARLLIEQVEDELPELKATVGKFLSGQSGETIAQLRKPAEDRISLARTNYEDALTRAQQIAVSWGILFGLWDIGTGKGNVESAERAYKEGYEQHSFNNRELLPLTSSERNTNALALGDDVSTRERLRVRGYSDADIARIEEEKALEQENLQTGLGNALIAAQTNFNKGLQ